MGDHRRPLLWLLGALALAVLLAIAVAPELRADLGTAAEIGVVTVAAGIPGLLVLLALARRRRGAADDDHPEAR